MELGKCTLIRSESFNYNNIGSLYLQSTLKTDMKTGAKTSYMDVSNLNDEGMVRVDSTEYVECIANLQYILQNIMPSELEDDVTYYYCSAEGFRFGVEGKQGFFKDAWNFYVQIGDEDSPKLNIDKKGVLALLNAFVHIYKETK